jgi:hypothetical protein
MFVSSVNSDPALLHSILSSKADEGKPVAKSLHTVTVLVDVTRYIEKYRGLGPSTALDEAMALLGLSDKPDTYGLKAQAHKKIMKG